MKMSGLRIAACIAWGCRYSVAPPTVIRVRENVSPEEAFQACVRLAARHALN